MMSTGLLAPSGWLNDAASCGTVSSSDMTPAPIAPLSQVVSNSGWRIALEIYAITRALVKSPLLRQPVVLLSRATKKLLAHCYTGAIKITIPAPCSPLLFICDYTAFTFGARVLLTNHFGQRCHNNRLKWDCLPWEKWPHNANSKTGQADLR